VQIFGALHERPDAIAGGFTVGQGVGGVQIFGALHERPDAIAGGFTVGQGVGGVQIFGALHERPDAIAGGFTVGQGVGGVQIFGALHERPDAIAGRLSAGKKLICALGATVLLLRGVSYIYRAHRLYLDNERYIVAAISGRPMQFKSGSSANAWADLLITRAAAEVGYSAALPAVRRLVWRESKIEALARYQDRLIQAAAKAADRQAQQAIIDEINAVEAKIASI